MHESVLMTQHGGSCLYGTYSRSVLDPHSSPVIGTKRSSCTCISLTGIKHGPWRNTPCYSPWATISKNLLLHLLHLLSQEWNLLPLWSSIGPSGMYGAVENDGGTTTAQYCDKASENDPLNSRPRSSLQDAHWPRGIGKVLDTPPAPPDEDTTANDITLMSTLIKSMEIFVMGQVNATYGRDLLRKGV